MIELTESAGARLHKSLAATRMESTDFKCFRVVPRNDRHLTLKIAKPAQSDVTVEHDGIVVLAVPKALGPFFRNKSLDIDATGQLRLS